MLRAVYKGGSSILLNQHNDEDYFYYYETKEERRKALIYNKDHSKDNHYRLWGSEPKVFLGCWAYPFMELVEGEEIEGIKDFSIFDHRLEIKTLLLRHISYFQDSWKQWYHILILCYMFKNGKMELTQAQLTKVQQVHDNGITEYLKTFCLNQLDLIQ